MCFDSGVANCICCSVCSLIIVVATFLILSFSSLPVNTYGLDYSPISKQINPNVFDSGFHYLGFMHKFIEYSSSTLSIDFSDGGSADRGAIESRSIDGLQVKFQAQFQYTLNKLKLTDLYMRYGDDYKSPCIRYAVDVLNDRATNFTATKFFQEIDTVKYDMQNALIGSWDAECFATVSSLQLTSAKLPTLYEKALQATSIANQSSITATQTQ